MWARFSEAMMMLGSVTCVVFAWPIRSQWHGLDYGQSLHSIALTGAAVGIAFAFRSVVRLRKEVADLRDRGRAANLTQQPTSAPEGARG